MTIAKALLSKPRTFMIGVVVLGALLAPSAASASFGIKDLQFSVNEAPAAGSPPGTLGRPDVQAGSHPYSMTVNFDLNETLDETPEGEVKDVVVNLPPGLVGNTAAAGQCTFEQFTQNQPGFQDPGSSYAFTDADCPNDSQVGVAEIKTASAFGPAGGFNHHLGLYNLVPPTGVPAELGVNIIGIPIILQISPRTGGDDGLASVVSNISQSLTVFGSRVTVWGVPADPSHDALRGECLGDHGQSVEAFPHQCSANESPKPFLTLPTSCPQSADGTPEPLTATIEADSWEEHGAVNPDGTPVLSDPRWQTAPAASAPGLTGCGRLSFRPAITVAPDTASADTPAGLTAEVRVPQDGLTEPGGLAVSTLRNTTVTLPEGLSVNPGQAAGLAACQASEDGVGTQLPPSCPLPSKVGTVEIQTPLLPDTLKGNVYVLPSNPPDIKLMMAPSGDGVNLKIVGDVHLDEATGRLTTTFENTPPLPFSDLKLAFSGGPQAALATPPLCGLYQTQSDFTPWTTPFTSDFFGSNSFAITTGPGGTGVAGCTGPLPFTPAMIAGATTDQAGGYTGFSLLLQRADGQQRIERLQFRTPPGLSGMISRVPLCGEPQAALGTCPAASQIGHTVVAAGPGPYPLIVPEPGRTQAPIYLTTGYRGAPYGLSIAVPVEAGPFVLNGGRPIVVRSSIAVDPHTAQLTVTTDPLPRIIDGVPTDLRTVNAVIDRPDFMFNPTNCSPNAFTGTASSYEGATAPLAYRFQVGSCRSLAFKPGFKVSTAGKTSKANGASLTARVTYPPVPLEANQAAGQANIASVKVDLPKQLPSRLTTLQKACTAKAFEANPASCPTASIVGHATAVTPVLPVPLTGPAYFVSHGGEAFPSLVIVLQGYGVTVDLVATTFISKAGITSSTFKQVPDVPFSTFTLTLPEGKYSALAANGNLCKSKLAMPTAFVAQNGAEIHQSTKIGVTGCPPDRAKAHKSKKQAKAKHRGRSRDA